MQKYKLREAMVGVARDADGHMKIITLPAAAVLAIATNTLQSGLVDAIWGDQIVAVFVQDVNTRGEQIQTTAT